MIKTKKPIVPLLTMMLLAIGLAPLTAVAVPSVTYQGQLKFEGVPFNGFADLSFALYDRETGGTQICTDAVQSVEVVDGLFTVELDFVGTDCFNGAARWLEIYVRTAESNATLVPRQPIAAAPYALYSFDAPGVSSLWQAAGHDIYYDDGNVGVGTTAPGHPLHVASSSGGPSVVGENRSAATMGQLGNEDAGVHGEDLSPGGVGVYGQADSGIGVHGEGATGVEGYTTRSTGYGIQGHNEAESGDAIAVFGQTGSPDGFGGYFSGKGYFSRNVGIGVTDPAEALDVAGTIQATGFKLTTAPAAGWVLTSNADGVGTWQPAGSGGATPWQIDPEDNIYYGDGFVGVGMGAGQPPLYPLHVFGTAAVSGLKVGDSATPGHVLTTDANGVGTWQAPSGGGSTVWGDGPEDHIYYNDGFVGIGTGSMQTPVQDLHVAGNGYFRDNVGIGVTNPIKPLDVSGDARIFNGNLHLGAEDVDAYIELMSDENSDATEMRLKSLDGVGFTVTNSADTPLFVVETSGDVGIGTTNPTEKLEVEGTVKMDGLQLGNECQAGYVLTADGSGVGTWQAPSGGGFSPWQDGPEDHIYYNDGFVGINTGGSETPVQPLHVAGNGYFRDNVGIGVEAPDMRLHVADAIKIVPEGSNPLNRFIRLGVNSAYARLFADGFAGLSLGAGSSMIMELNDTSVSINGAIGDDALMVNGLIRTNGFRLNSGPVEGYVLTSDTEGYGSWQPAPDPGGGDFTLPVDETVDVDDASAFKITNTGTGNSAHAITGIITNASSDASAGYFSAQGSGAAIHAESDNTRTIYVHNSGGGQAVYGSTSGSGGGSFSSSMNGGYGVKGKASSSGSSSENRGGWFEASGPNGRGVYARTTGAYGRAVQAVAEGGEGIGVYAEAPWTGIEARSSYNAAKFYGDVRIYEYGTTNRIFHVDDSDGTTTVQVLQIDGGADLAEPFDVAGGAVAAEPGMLVSIDPDNVGKLAVSNSAYDFKVAGVISGAGGIRPGMVMGQEGSVAHGEHPVALTGRVWTFCDATQAAIKPGDLLTTSDTPGHAMKVTSFPRAQGAIIGKAMSPLAKGERGLVLVLVNLQ